jgi:hypothetical protein
MNQDENEKLRLRTTYLHLEVASKVTVMDLRKWGWDVLLPHSPQHFEKINLRYLFVLGRNNILNKKWEVAFKNLAGVYRLL